MTALSIVIPVYNEEGVLEELISRCRRAAHEVADNDFELIIVNDGSSDGTREILQKHPDVVAIHLEKSHGQFPATQAGLRRAQGQTVVVLDGDLQDPPEILPTLVTTLRASPDIDVVFACKTARGDGPIMKGAAWFYQLLQRFGAHVMPWGAGSFCAMRHASATRAGSAKARQVNLAAVLLTQGVKLRAVPYEKQARYDDQSRVGALGLLREALTSLWLTGSLKRLGALILLTLLVVFFLKN